MVMSLSSFKIRSTLSPIMLEIEHKTLQIFIECYTHAFFFIINTISKIVY